MGQTIKSIIKEIKNSNIKIGREIEEGLVNIFDILEDFEGCEVKGKLLREINEYEGYTNNEIWSEIERGNTYNYNSRISHDINWSMFQFKGRNILEIRVHLYGDIRCNYSDTVYILWDYFKSYIGEDYEDFRDYLYSKTWCTKHNGCYIETNAMIDTYIAISDCGCYIEEFNDLEEAKIFCEKQKNN